MSARQFERGWRDGYEAMLERLSGFGYWTPGLEQPQDYLLGFAAGQEAALWWQRGYEDGTQGRRARRGVPETFAERYWTGMRAGAAERRAEVRHAA
jgi:hypothetical protein